MTPSQTLAALDILLAAGQPAFLWGPPGVGKSRLVTEAARRRGMLLHDIRAVLLDPVDLRGLPRIAADGKTVWCAPSFLPDESDAAQGVLFLDELNAAPPLVQAACYQLILDRRIGEYRLPDGWCVLAAGNREGDRAVSCRMPTALANRMTHISVVPDIDDWLLWAETADIHPDIRAFLRFRPRLLLHFDPASGEQAFASPRSWEFASAILRADPSGDVREELLAGAVGKGAAAELCGYLAQRHSLPELEDILADPDRAAIPDDPAALYALCEGLARRVREETLDAIADYAARLPAEFGVLLFREAARHDATVIESRPFARWAQQHAEVLL